MALTISRDISLPLDTVTDTIAVLAVKGSGKTYCACVIAEEMIGTGQPVVVVDPVGVAWGLRLHANGKDAGLNVIIFGGEKGDVPLEPGAGHLIADFVVQERRSCVLDLSAFETKADQRRFLLDFTQRLYQKNREPLHVILDEADDYIPQKPFGDETHLLRAFEVLVRRGRARGLGVTMITQRAAVINKSVLTQTSILIVGRTTSPQDRKAVEAWVEGHSTDENAKVFWDSLAALPKEQKWVWAPGLEVFKRVNIRECRTFDSSSTPKVGEVRAQPRTLAPVDLESLRGRIAATIEKAKAEDPKALRARVKELEAQLAKKEAAPVIYEPVMRAVAETMRGLDGEIAGLEESAARLRAMKVALLEALAQSEIDGAKVQTMSKAISIRTQKEADDHFGAGSGGAELARKGLSIPTQPPIIRHLREVAAAGDPKLGKCERAILTVLAQHHPNARSKVQVAILAGYSHSSGGFRNSLSALRSAGMIDGGGDAIRITADGVSALGAFEPLPAGRALLEYWMQHAGGRCERLILAELADVHPRALPKEAIASRTGYHATSGGFRNALSRLRTLELIKGRGEIKIADTLAEAS